MKKVGVLGGMGPEATVYFNDLIISNTNAKCDQEHLDMLVSIHSTIPDRTAYLLGKSNKNPLPYLISDAKMLEKCGCDFLVLTCNTSHFFYDDIKKKIKIPFLNMPLEVCKIINGMENVHKVGIMATTGTIKTKIYDKYLQKEIFYPDEILNQKVMNLIYNKVKKGIKVSKQEFLNVLADFYKAGCDMVITACTELSVIVKDNNLYDDSRLIDSMKVLVDKTILLAKDNS